MRRWIVASVVLLAARGSDACILSVPALTTFPALVTPAPLGAHVLLDLAPDWQRACLDDEPEDRCRRGDYWLDLRTAPPSVRVPHRTLATRGDARAIVEVVPDAPLQPSTTYEVWLVDRSPARRDRFLSAFRTGVANDAHPPTWKTPPKLTIHAVAPKNPKVIELELCGPNVDLEVVAEASDDGPVRYAVWFARDGAIDYSAPPFRLSAQGVFDVVTRDTKMFPRGVPVRVGVRALDASRNMTPPWEQLVTLP